MLCEIKNADLNEFCLSLDIFLSLTAAESGRVTEEQRTSPFDVGKRGQLRALREAERRVPALRCLQGSFLLWSCMPEGRLEAPQQKCAWHTRLGIGRRC